LGTFDRERVSFIQDGALLTEERALLRVNGALLNEQRENRKRKISFLIHYGVLLIEQLFTIPPPSFPLDHYYTKTAFFSRDFAKP